MVEQGKRAAVFQAFQNGGFLSARRRLANPASATYTCIGIRCLLPECLD